MKIRNSKTHRSELSTLGRRDLLKALGASTLALPFLYGITDRSAHAQGMMKRPKRLVIVQHGQGTLLDQWKPMDAGANYTLSPLLQPLQSVKEQMLVISGVSNQARNSQRQGNGHVPAGRSLLSATPFKGSYYPDGTLRPGEEHPDADDSYGPSIDQVIAERIAAPMQRLSVNLSVQNSDHENRLYWKGPPGQTQLINNEADPTRAFSTFFGGVTFPEDNPTPPTRAERFRARSSKVLDRTISSYDSLKTQLPAEDRASLERHAEQLKTLQMNLAAQIEVEGACARPELLTPDGYNPQADVWADLSTDNQIDLLVMSLACDVSRVATLQFGNKHAPQFSFLPNYTIPIEGYSNWHDMIHKQGDMASSQALFRGFEWYSTKVAQLVAKLAATPEGDGSLLDNTLVVWLSEFGNGGGHNTSDLPVVCFGNLGGTVRTGEHLALSGRTTNELFIALLQAFGSNDTSFGLATSISGESLIANPLTEIFL